MKKNAIYIPSSNRFSFALANVLMSIVDNSGGILVDTDVLVLTDDMSDRNKQVMKKIIPDIIFLPLYRNLPMEMLEAECVKIGRYGIFIYQLLYGFEAVKRYEYVLQLETDMFVVSDLSVLFKLDCDIAWRNVLAWDPKKVLKGVLRNQEDEVLAPNGGVVLFRNSLNKYNIDQKSFYEAFRYLEPLDGKVFNFFVAMNEQIVCYLCYMRKINVKLLNPSYNNVGLDVALPDEKIIHFGGRVKPWTDELCGSLMPQWFINHKKFMSYGGECEEKINFPVISRRRIYDALKYGGWAINLIPCLDIIKEPNVQMKCTQGRHCIQFFVNGWPEYIHYEITLHVVNVSFGLHVEGAFQTSSIMVATLKTLELSLKKLLPRYGLVTEEGRISLGTYSNKDDIPMINYLMNVLFAKTYPKVNSILCESDKDVIDGSIS